jgi:hypothetical protein
MLFATDAETTRLLGSGRYWLMSANRAIGAVRSVHRVDRAALPALGSDGRRGESIRSNANFGGLGAVIHERVGGTASAAGTGTAVAAVAAWTATPTTTDAATFSSRLSARCARPTGTAKSTVATRTTIPTGRGMEFDGIKDDATIPNEEGDGCATTFACSSECSGTATHSAGSTARPCTTVCAEARAAAATALAWVARSARLSVSRLVAG